jgi:hypothetical protein
MLLVFIFTYLMIATLYKKHKSLLEFSLRLYIAYYIFDYGLSKLTGDMFNNATPEVLKTELQRVDLFHLTWYFFYKSWLLTYVVGVLQVASALLLLFRKTVLLGCLIALPIMINIFLIDVTAFPDPALAIRVFLYIACLMLFISYRRVAVQQAIASLLHGLPAPILGKSAYFLWIAVILLAFFVIEFILCRGISLIF